jgi:hypothetical protein
MGSSVSGALRPGQDGNLVKVRLGSFEREEDAQVLKERAVKSGYSGAFRVLDRGGS